MLSASCGAFNGGRHDSRARVKTETAEPVQLYSPAQAGITLATNAAGEKLARWKERISPVGAVSVPFAAPEGGTMRHPRVAAVLAGFGPIDMVLDTGAPVCLLNDSGGLSGAGKFVDPSQMANTFRGFGAEKLMRYCVLDELRLGELALRDTLAALHQPGRDGGEIENLIGLSTLAKFGYITLDPFGGEAVFCLACEFVPPPGAAQVPFTFSGMQILADIEINKKFALTLLVDTGNEASLMLNEASIAALGLAGEAARGKSGVYTGLGGKTATKSFRAGFVKIGKILIEDVEVIAVSGDFPPSIGYGLLRRFTTTFDFRRNCLWLEP
jgi:predicted aspartyl protease